MTRDGIDLSKGGPQVIESLWSLVGAQATAKVNETVADAHQSLVRPKRRRSQTRLPDMLDKLTTTSDEYLEGRININQARREVLICLPTMKLREQIVNGIIAAQHLDSNGQPSLDTLRQHNTTAWLYSEGIVDLPGMHLAGPLHHGSR